MAKNWSEYAKAQLDTDDEVQKNFSAKYNGNYGYIVMTKRKILFVEEKGFFSKTFSVLLDLGYRNMETSIAGTKQLTITDRKSGEKHVFATDYAPATTIETNLKELIAGEI